MNPIFRKRSYFIVVVYPLITLLILSCTDSTDGYYTVDKEWDLWRFPLIKPYELVSPTNYSTDDWVLILDDFNPYNTDSKYQLTNIDSIGILENIVLLHSHRARYPGGNRPLWLIINGNNAFKQIITDKEEVKFVLDKLGAQNIKIYPFHKLKKDFQEKNILPPSWYLTKFDD